METKVLVIMDTLTYNAGHNVTGEIFACSSNSSLNLKIIGKEKVRIINTKNEIIKRESIIINHYEHIASLEDCNKVVFPFCFKLPNFCPATFHFLKEDNEGNLIKAVIKYKITAEVLQNTIILTSDDKYLTVLQNSFSSSRNNCVISFSEHATCFCIPADRVSMKISLASKYSAISNFPNFMISCLEIPRRSEIVKIIGMTVYELSIMIPGHRTYNFYYEINSISGVDKNLEFSADVGAKFGENHGSNQTSLIRSIYKVQGILEYKYRCKIRSLDCSLYFHVNPHIVKTPKLSNSFEKSKEFPIINIVLKDESGRPMSPCKHRIMEF